MPARIFPEMTGDGLSPALENTSTRYALIVTLAAFVVYATTLANGFVWDDGSVILNNQALRGSVLSLFNSIDAAYSSEPTPYYRPLTMLTFWVDARVHGFNPVLIRLFNLLLHSANAFLVYRLALMLLKNAPAALLAGLLFAVHPVNSETVSLNAARNTLLATFFIISSYLVHAHSARKRSYGGALFGSLLFLLGLLSKEVAVGILPFITALEISGSRAAGIPLKTSIARLLPYAAGLAGYRVLRHQALSLAGVTLDIIPGLAARLLANIYIIPAYVLKVVYPVGFSPVYFVPENLHLLALPLLAGWLCIVAAAVWTARCGTRDVTIAGAAWMVVFWLPVSGLIPIPSAPLADRYLYLPAIGLWLMVASQAVRVTGGRAWTRSACVAAALLLAMLAVLSYRRSLDWKDDATLFSRMVEVYPDRAYGYHNLGCYYMDKRKDFDTAASYFAKALQLDPAFPRLRTQIGYLMLQRGDYPAALQQYAEALAQNPYDAEAYLNSGFALERLQRFEEALSAYRNFLKLPSAELAGSRPAVEAKVQMLSQMLGVGMSTRTIP